MKGKLIIFSAPSGSGKTTIVRRVMQSRIPLEFSISATSRLPRNNEKDGVDYYFLTPEEFRYKIANNEFLEWEEVYENQYYGTLISEVEKIRNRGYNVVFDVDVVGGLNIKRKYSDEALSIFISPPSFAALKERLELRGTETPESLLKRLSKVKFEMDFASQFDLIIINDILENAVFETILSINKFLGLK
jgi:guanylate kinase